MKNNGNRDKKNQLEAHSLPGTNQAGKGPGSGKASTSADQTARDAHVEGGSGAAPLPGVTHAAKGRRDTPN